MAVETASDRLIFLDVDDFGTTASYTVQGGSAADVKGIFDNEHIEVDATGSVGVSIQEPRFLCRTSDVSSATEGDAITINSINYKIRVVQDDGTGITNLVLEVV